MKNQTIKSAKLNQKKKVTYRNHRKSMLNGMEKG